jgi:hypothetical protein
MEAENRPAIPQDIYDACAAARKEFRSVEFDIVWSQYLQKHSVIYWPIGQRSRRVTGKLNSQVRAFLGGFISSRRINK